MSLLDSVRTLTTQKTRIVFLKYILCVSYQIWHLLKTSEISSNPIKIRNVFRETNPRDTKNANNLV